MRTILRLAAILAMSVTAAHASIITVSNDVVVGGDWNTFYSLRYDDSDENLLLTAGELIAVTWTIIPPGTEAAGTTPIGEIEGSGFDLVVSLSNGGEIISGTSGVFGVDVGVGVLAMNFQSGENNMGYYNYPTGSNSWRQNDHMTQFTVSSSPVPIPAAAWLFGSALLGLGALKRKKA